MTKLPAKFEICTKYNRTSRYVLTLNAEGYYEMAPAQRTLEDAYDVLKKYSQGFVKEAVQDGMWEITRNLDVLPATEPEMVFPIYAKHSDPEYQDEACSEANIKIEKSDLDGYVKVTWGDGSVNDGFWSVEAYKRLIEQGIWIVKHVGEKAPEQKLEYAPNEKYADKGDRVTHVQAPQSRSINNLSVDIKCDTDAAVEAVERLTQALEDLAISYESVIALQREFKEGV